MSGLAAMMLLFPNSPLAPLWQLNPRARDGFAAMGLGAVLLMGVVCVACAIAATGLFRSKRWGYALALLILSVNLAGDAVNVLLLRDWRASIGIPVGGLMILYLVSRRKSFAQA